MKSIYVRVGMAHYYRESNEEKYGSGRKGNKLRRQMALAKSIESWIGLGQMEANAVLNIREQKIEVAYAKDHKNIKLETSITTNGKDRLGDILDIYRERAIERAVELEDPRLLPLETAKALILADPIADLTIYTEDDLIVQGNSFIEKVLEFYEHADSGSVLMPHRYEVCNTNYPMKLWVDGPIVRQYRI